jgi:hypothetical protein
MASLAAAIVVVSGLLIALGRCRSESDLAWMSRPDDQGRRKGLQEVIITLKTSEEQAEYVHRAAWRALEMRASVDVYYALDDTADVAEINEVAAALLEAFAAGWHQDEVMRHILRFLADLVEQIVAVRRERYAKYIPNLIETLGAEPNPQLSPYDHAWIAVGILTGIGKDAVGPLVGALGSENPLARVNALRALSGITRMGVQEGHVALLLALQSKHADVREEAARDLAIFEERPPVAPPSLEELLRLPLADPSAEWIRDGLRAFEQDPHIWAQLQSWSAKSVEIADRRTEELAELRAEGTEQHHMEEMIAAMREYAGEVRAVLLESGRHTGWCYLDLEMGSVVAFYYYEGR